ncbi:MAG: PLP-dependent aminotransferase family protein, partial [Kofleriaceae bacterium]|nr:PLP-dependent aminotransferase family protein [Kofleriaceae bacterium]
MSRQAPALDVVLGKRARGATLASWLYDELRAAILDGRLARGARLPATRDLASRHGVSRGVVVGVFERLADEGYLSSRVGSGTIVRARVPEDYLPSAPHVARVTPDRAGASAHVDRRASAPGRAGVPADVDRRASAPGRAGVPARVDRRAGAPGRAEGSAHADRRGSTLPVPRPFSPIEPALAEFPIQTWARLSARVLARISPRLLARADPAGSPALRTAVAAYLGASRGVACTPDQVVIVSGAQQALDLIARLVIQPGDPVWIEDPAYSGALDAFRNARAKIVPVRVDNEGIDPAHGRQRCARPAAVYLTPAHQFPLGVSLAHQRRVDLVRWANANGTVLIE